MKPIFNRLVALFAIILVQQTSFSQGTFQKLYGITTNDNSLGMASSGNGEYVLAGTSLVNSQDYAVMKVDETGSLIWSKIVSANMTSDEVGYSTFINSHGSIYVTGYTSFGGPGSVNGNLVKLDASGQVKWSQNYGVSVLEQYGSISNYGDTALLLSGFSFENSLDVFATKVDSNGVVIWSRLIGSPNAELSFKGIATNDGGALMMAVSDQGAGSDDILIVKLDNTGAIEWQKLFGTPTQDIISGAVQISSGYILACASSGNAKAIALDNSGNFVWVKEYQNTNNQTVNQIRRVDNNRFVIVGSTDLSGVIGVTLEIDSLGVLQSANGYGGIQTVLYDVALTSDQGLMLSGITNSSGVSGDDIYLARTDSTGNSGCSDTLITSQFNEVSFTYTETPVSITSTANGSALSNMMTSTDVNYNINTVCECFPSEQPVLDQTSADVCLGDSILVSVTGGNLNSGSDWYWYESSCGGTLVGTGSSVYLSPTQNTTYFVRGEASCADGECASITVNVNIADTSVTLIGITLEASSSGASYSWIDCNTLQPIIGETGQSFTPTTNGLYAMVITENGCTDTSSCYVINSVGLDEHSYIPSIYVYPNPTSEEIIVLGVKEGMTVNYTIMDAQGQLISENELLHPNINISNLANGIYYLRFDADAWTEVIKVLKK